MTNKLLAIDEKPDGMFNLPAFTAHQVVRAKTVPEAIDVLKDWKEKEEKYVDGLFIDFTLAMTPADYYGDREFKFKLDLLSLAKDLRIKHVVFKFSKTPEKDIHIQKKNSKVDKGCCSNGS